MPHLPAAQQPILLDLADLDQQLRAARHRRATLPEQEALDALVARHRALGEEHAQVKGELAGVVASHEAAEAEVARLSARIDSDAAKLASGEGLTSRDLVALEEEIAGFRTRLGAAEDAELEILEQREGLEGRVATLAAEAEQVATDGKAAAGARQTALATVDTEISELEQQRGAKIAELPRPIVADYQARVDSGGVGAAQRSGQSCPGCGQVFSAAELRALDSLGADELFACEECGCLIVAA